MLKILKNNRKLGQKIVLDGTCQDRKNKRGNKGRKNN